MENLKQIRNPYLIFLPFLLVFIAFVLIFHTDAMEGDESRYLFYAQNLLHGYYSPTPPNIRLENGPGYPILLMPFVGLQLPLIFVTLLNAVFHYLSIVFLFKALQQITTFRVALIFALLWAFYYNSYQKMPRILTESLTLFLIALLIFFLVKAFREKSNKYIIFSGFIIGYIALTKVLFGYVVLFMLLGFGSLWVINRKDIRYSKGILIIIIAFIFTLPYLIYTYNLTGKVFYWANTGGNALYWLSSPRKGEFGDFGDYAGKVPASHQKVLEEIFKLNSIERDDLYKRIALYNIKKNPIKFAQNYISNIGRLFFNFPYTPSFQHYNEIGNPIRSLLLLPSNAILFSMMIFCSILTIVKWKKMEVYMRFLLFFALLYIGGSSILSAQSRMFYVIVPVIIFWIAYVIEKTIKITFK